MNCKQLKMIFLVAIALLGYLSVYSQTGKVVDSETDEALIGATVVLRGTMQGNVTDINGEFTLPHISQGDTIDVTYIGYEPNSAIWNGDNDLLIKLDPRLNELDEQVVVGYGVQKKNSITGSVSNLTSEVIEDRSVANLPSALQGMMPGLNISQSSGAPGKEASVNIRGFTSINGGGPLILIDGVEGDLNNVNPSDVKSVSVLKDAASAAVYGARAAFGVVLVTTKASAAGDIKVNYSSKIGWGTTTTRTDYMTDPYDVLVLIDSSFATINGRIYSGYTPDDYDEIKKRSEDPSLPDYIIDNRGGEERYIYYGNTDWWKEMFFDYQPTQDHRLSVSGGNEEVSFRLSGRIYNKDGLLKIKGGEERDNFKSYNVRNKTDININKHLKLTHNIAFDVSKNVKYGGGKDGYYGDPFGYRGWIHALPSYIPQNPDGTATATMGLNNYIFSNGIFADMLYGRSKEEDKRYGILNMFGINISPIQSINLHADYTVRYDFTDRYMRSVKFPYSQYPGVIEVKGHDWLREYQNKSFYQAINAYGSFEKYLGYHHMKITAGYNQEHKRYKYVRAEKSELLTDDLNALNLGTIIPYVAGSSTEWAVMGVFGRVAYDYKSKYLLEFNGRYDGSSRFPEGNRWGGFPSGSVGWVVSEEDFINENSWLSFLKIRASYGSLGNQQVSNYAFIPTLNKRTEEYLYQGTQIESMNTPSPNPRNITWEEVNTINAGVDISLFNNHFDASVDLFERQTIGMLTKGKTLPATFGATPPKENSADLSTKGFEITMSYRNRFNLESKPFNFVITANLANQVTHVTRFDNPSKYLGDYYEGMRIGEIWGYHIEGLFQTNEAAAEEQANVDYTTVAKNSILRSPGEFGKLLAGDMNFADIDGDKAINAGENTLENHGDLQVIGNSDAQFPYSFNFSADWNGFDLSAFFQGIGKQYWYPLKAEQFFGVYHRPYVSFIRKDMVEDMWSEDNPDGYYPRLRGYESYGAGRTMGEVNDRYLQDISYLRMKNLTIGYSVPKRFLSKINVDKLRVYFSGENLLTFTSLTKYVDPEAAFQGEINYMNRSSVESNARGQAYPHTKLFSFGVDLTF
jgi:TonB-linked SusC/RagA family outer membrane protein